MECVDTLLNEKAPGSKVQLKSRRTKLKHFSISLKLTHCFVSGENETQAALRGAFYGFGLLGISVTAPLCSVLGLLCLDGMTSLDWERRTFFYWRSNQVEQWGEALKTPGEPRRGNHRSMKGRSLAQTHAAWRKGPAIIVGPGSGSKQQTPRRCRCKRSGKTDLGPVLWGKVSSTPQGRDCKSQTLWLPINGSSYFSACEIVWIVADESGGLKWQTNGSAKGVLSDAGRAPRYQRHTLRQHNKLERYLTCDEYFRPWSFISRIHSGEAKMSRKGSPDATTVLAHSVFSMLKLSWMGGSQSSWGKKKKCESASRTCFIHLNLLCLHGYLAR